MKISQVLQRIVWGAGVSMGLTIASFAQAVEVKSALAKPFVTGASVSADWTSKSPGKTLALRFTDADKIKTVAFGGRPGREIIRSVREEDLNDRSIILAIDFLFWDSTGTQLKASTDAIHTLVGHARRRKIPIVLGEIPELLPGRQGLREELNDELRKSCSAYAQCLLMPFDRLHTQLIKDGTLEIGGRKLSKKELVPDGLHLSQVATEFLADEMLALLSNTKS